MKLITAQALAEAAEALGVEGVNVRESYSGRGMYGDTTSGVVCKSVGDLLICAAEAALMLAADPASGDAAADAFLEDLRDVSWDGMGLSVIVY
jgi:hypothetical protein